MSFNRQTFDNLERDISDTGEAVNECKIITPRYGPAFKSIPLVAEEASVKVRELSSAIDTALAAGAGEAGWTSDLISFGKYNQTQINNAFIGKRWLAPLYGVKANGIDDDSEAIQNIINMMSDGDILVLEPKKHRLVNSITVDKVIKIESTIRSQSLTATLNCEKSGLLINKPYCSIKNISLMGSTSGVIFDFDRRIFGNIGIKNSYGSNGTSGGTILENVFISNFDVNLAEYQEAGQGWAGAYREYYNIFLRYGRINYLALDGVTHTVFHGGGIQAAIENGVYAKATFNGGSEQSYNNIEFLGTTIEGNGFHTENFNSENWKRIAIYAGENTKINLFGSYSEKQSTFSENGGQINFFGCHQHSNSRLFAVNGSVNETGGLGAKQTKLVYQSSLAPLFNSTTATIKNVLVGDKKMRIQSSNSGGNTFIFTKSFPLKGLKGKDLKAIKVGFAWMFTSGFTKNTNLLVQPIARIVSTAANSSDTSRANYDYPLDVLKKSYGTEHYFEFYNRPRSFGTPYLDPDSELSTLQIQFHFKNGDIDADFSLDNLDAYINNLNVTLYADKETALTLDLARAGGTSDKPTNLSAFEVGVGYFDTQLNQYEVWNGTNWVVLAKKDEATPATATTTEMQTITHSINTTGKIRGKPVFNTTIGKMFNAIGVQPNSAWRASDSSMDITPS